MIISARKQIDYQNLQLRAADEAECLAAGMTGAEAVKHSVDNSDWYEAVYLNGQLAVVWGYARGSFFTPSCVAWLLTTDLVEEHKVWFAKSSLRCLRYLFETFEEVLIEVHLDHKLARDWLSWLCFDAVSHNNGFMLMKAKRSESRWVH